MMQPTAAGAELVLLHIGHWGLAVPRHEVRDLLSPQDLGTDNTGALGVRIGARDVPVLVLDDRLRPTDRLPAARRICVVLDAGGTLFGLMCDEFEHRIIGATRRHELEPAQRSPGAPLRAVLQIGEQVAAITDACALLGRFEASMSLATEAA